MRIFCICILVQPVPEETRVEVVIRIELRLGNEKFHGLFSIKMFQKRPIIGPVLVQPIPEEIRVEVVIVMQIRIRTDRYRSRLKHSLWTETLNFLVSETRKFKVSETLNFLETFPVNRDFQLSCFRSWLLLRWREVGGWGRVPFSRNLMSPTPRRKWYLTTGRRAD